MGRRTLVLLRLALALCIAPLAGATTIVSNMANTAGPSQSPQSTFWVAQKFTNGPAALEITSVQFRGAKNNAGQPISFFVYDHDAINDKPLSQIGSLNTASVTAVAGTQTMTPNGTILLASGASYWLVFAPGDINTAIWTRTSDLTSTGTGSIPNRNAFSTTSGASWVAPLTTDNLMLQVDGAPPADTTPDAFAFIDQTDVPLSSTITSNAITVSGIDSSTAISVTGGEYSINGGGFTSVAGSVNDGDSVRVRHTSSASFSTATNTTLDIGGVTDTFTSTTLAADMTPDPFTFTDQTNVNLSTVIVSNAITVSGINTAAPISVTGGEYSINGGGFTSAAGSVNDGDSVRVRHTSSASFATSTDTTLTIGGVSDTFTSVTAAASEPVPTLGGLGLLMMATIMAAAAMLIMRGR